MIAFASPGSGGRNSNLVVSSLKLGMTCPLLGEGNKKRETATISLTQWAANLVAAFMRTAYFAALFCAGIESVRTDT